MNILRKFRAYLKYQKAINMAESLSKKTGERYYVLPSMDGSLNVVNRSSFRYLKRKGYIPTRATMKDVVRECFYYTADNKGNAPMLKFTAAKKKKQYYDWSSSLIARSK